VHVAVSVGDFARKFPHALPVADVGDVRGRRLIAAGVQELTVQRGERVLLDVNEGEVAALGPKMKSECATDAVGRAGDNGGLATKLADAYPVIRAADCRPHRR
jgi:hypothetical protein